MPQLSEVCSSLHCSWHRGGTWRECPGLLPWLLPWPPWLFVTSVVTLGSGGWTRKEGHCCPPPARPMSQCHPNGTSDTQAGYSGLSRPASPLGKLNHPQRAPPATKTHLQPFGRAQPCPIPAPHCHFGAQEWACPLQRLLVAQGSLGTWDSSAWQCPSTRSGGFPVFMWEVITAQSLQVHKNI